MTDDKFETKAATFEVVAPVLQVTDVARARTYYVEQLGFDVQFEWADAGENAPRYAVVRKERTELHLTKNDKPVPSTVYFFVDGVQAYYDAVRQTSALITEDIRDHPWEMREFQVQDPDGNRLLFGEHLSRLKSGTGG